jgi:hypothetical protein
MSKYLTVPAEITLKNPLNKEQPGDKMTFREFVFVCLLTDKRFSGGWQAIKAAISISDAVEAAEPGKTFQLDQADWEQLKAVVESPTGGQYGNGQLNGIGLMQLRPYFEAVLNAADRAPKAVKAV